MNPVLAVTPAPVRIASAFSSARQDASPANGQVSTAELQRIFRHVRDDGFSDGAKQAFVDGFEALYVDRPFVSPKGNTYVIRRLDHATKGAETEFFRVSSKHDLPALSFFP